VELPFTIRNDGTVDLSGFASESCPQFEMGAGAGPYTLKPGEEKTVFVRFRPTVSGTHTCTVDLGTADCPGVFCTGIAAFPAQCRVSPTFLDFGDVGLGQTAERTLQVVNAGGVEMLGDVGLSGCSPDFALVSGGGFFLLAPGETLLVTVAFTPSTEGTQDCSLSLGATECDPVSITGNGITCSIDPASIDFGSVPVESFATRTFTITNFTNDPLSGDLNEPCTLYSLDPSGPFTIPPGAEMLVTVRFDALKQGQFDCTIETGLPCGPVFCTALSEPPPACSVSPSFLDFGVMNPGEVQDLGFTIQNVGGGTLTGSVSIPGSCVGFSIVSGGGSFALGANEIRTVVVRFSSLNEGLYQCDLNLGSACGTFSLQAEVVYFIPAPRRRTEPEGGGR
jgi:hypothetical protein